MTEHVLRIVGLSGIQAHGGDPAGLYVVDCDVDAHRGIGEATFTDDRAKARRFATPADALAFWRRQSNVRPLRDDGKPNRPLCAYTVETVPIDRQPS